MRSSTENIYQEKVNQVIDYISANLHQPLQLDVIAERICVSRRQLLRIMRSALDESLYAYMARQRMERAIMYMQTEEMTLAGLARAGRLRQSSNRSRKRLRNNSVSLRKLI